MSKSLSNAFSHTEIRRVGTTTAPDCYIAALRVEERVLVDWKEDVTGRLSPIVDIFLAFVSYHLASCRAALADDDASIHKWCLQKCSALHAFLIREWGVESPNYYLEEARKLKIRCKRKKGGSMH